MIPPLLEKLEKIFHNIVQSQRVESSQSVESSLQPDDCVLSLVHKYG
jgi:hypothetical protein